MSNLFRIAAEIGEAAKAEPLLQVAEKLSLGLWKRVKFSARPLEQTAADMRAAEAASEPIPEIKPCVRPPLTAENNPIAKL